MVPTSGNHSMLVGDVAWREKAEAAETEQHEPTILPVQRVNAGIKRRAARELLFRKLRGGAIFIIKRRSGRSKQIEENRVTRMTDREMEFQRSLFDKMRGGGRELALQETRVVGLNKILDAMTHGLLKFVTWGDNTPEAQLIFDTEAEEKRKAKLRKEKLSEVQQARTWRGMRTESNRNRRLRLHQPRRQHIKKHEQYDPFFGGKNKPQKSA